MTKSALLSSTAVFAVIVGSALGAPYPVATARPPNLHPPAVPPNFLYNQNSNFGTAIGSQNFTGGTSTYSDAAADDFVIPAGQKWKITGVDVTGTYSTSTGRAASETVTFYSDRKGYPDKVKATFTLNCTDSNGNFACKLPGNGLGLSGGTVGRAYWVSVVANCAFYGSDCLWYWYQNTKIRHFEGVWENPENGDGTGCTTWGRNSACLLLPGDYAFDLRGKKS